MNKKTLVIFCVILVAAALLWWFFIKKDGADIVGPEISDTSCLIYQSEDSAQPCYSASAPTSSGGVFPQGPGAVESPTGTSSPASLPPALSECEGSSSLIERNGCITEVAQESGNKTLCGSIRGTLAQAACFSGISSSVLAETFSPPKNTYESFIKEFSERSRTVGIRAATSSKPVFSSGAFSILDTSVATSPDTTVEAFYARTSLQAQLALYTTYPYQVRPNGELKLVGSGFALDKTNDVVFQGQRVSGISSPDGMTLLVTVPSLSEGTYEVWVENKRGSSRVSARPIYMVVSQNPVPPPVITAVSPENPSSTDVITLSGNNLSNIQGVYTSLGRVPNNSLSFRVSDLEYAHLATNSAATKGLKTIMVVFVQTDGGLSEQPFTFEVQF